MLVSWPRERHMTSFLRSSKEYELEPESKWAPAAMLSFETTGWISSLFLS